MKIIKTSFDKIEKYRLEYLDSLSEFQELFIEFMINDSDFYLLRVNNKDIGYVIIRSEGILVEFYVKNEYIVYSHKFFLLVMEDLSISDIYCKSFDSILLSNCLLSSLQYSVIGVLYRDYVEPLIKKDLEIKFEKAYLSSVEFLLRQDDSIKELFETEEQLIDFIQNQNVFNFYKQDEFIGCGMVLKTHKLWNYCDLGVWVHPDKRGNSFGAQILLNLREFALKNNMQPSCGCPIENLASQKTIEKSGFISKYQLINFKINNISADS